MIAQGRDVDVVIVGAGFAGLGLARALRRAGVTDLVILERAQAVGGTWRDNVYPGVACDVPTPLYSYSFALQPLRGPKAPHGWSGLYAPQAELRDYLERCATQFGLRDHLVLGADVEAADWDDAAARWRVQVRRGDRVEAWSCRALVSASGHALRVPKAPSLDGAGEFARGREAGGDRAGSPGSSGRQREFRGVQIHTARWDPGLDLTGKRVAVIGTGASAAQLIPAIVGRVAHLTVYQRTAGWVLPRVERAGRDAAMRRIMALPGGARLVRWGLYWFMELIAAGHVFDPRLHERFTEPVARAHLRAQVADPALREKLTPRFRLGCKRMIISNDLYPALTRPNVTLVTDAILGLAPEGVRTAQGVTPVDVVIYATGYEAAEAPPPFALRGRDGRRLEDVWSDGPEAHRGTTIAGFPNLFLMVGPNLGQGHTSMVFMMESQFPYVVAAIRRLCGPRPRARRLEVRSDAQSAWNTFLQRRLRRTVWNSGGCTSWYLAKSGRNTTAWPGFTFEYWLRMRRFDAESYRVG